MEIRIDRKWKKYTYTISNLYVNGIKICEALEDKDRGLKDSMKESEIKSKKIYGQTAIPSGKYKLTMSYSSKFAARTWASKYNGKVLEVQNVKGFAGVRVHPGNTATDTLGCILVGRNTEVGKVTNSTKYYYKLLDEYILPAMKKGENVFLIIS